MLAGAFTSIALKVSAATGAGYFDAVARWSGVPVMEGGSIVTPGTPVEKSCSVQVDSVTEAMRAAEGYSDQDMRLLVLATTLDGELDTDATVEVLAGPHIGAWQLATVSRDPAGIAWECRGRRL